MCHRQSLGDCAGRRRLRRLLPQRRQVIFTIIAGVRLPSSFAVGFELMAVQYGRGRGAQSWPRVLGCCAGTGYDCPQCRGNPAAIPRLLGRALSLRTSPSFPVLAVPVYGCVRKLLLCLPWYHPYLVWPAGRLRRSDGCGTHQVGLPFSWCIRHAPSASASACSIRSCR